MSKVTIIPNVKSYTDLHEKINFNKLSCSEVLNEFHHGLLYAFLDDNSLNKLEFEIKENISVQGYQIKVNKNGIKCYYSDEEGKHNAILTLYQILKQQKQLTTCLIKDEPLFKVRSIMIDISRNKVPTLKTLMQIIDELALVKINDLQLYVEGRSFYFESLSKYYENKEDFLTPEDVTILRKYASDRGIVLTPNINTFAHMAYWMNQKDLNHLALQPEGFRWSDNGLLAYAGTINPALKESKEFVYTLIEDILKYYPDCKTFNIGGDEPFELLFPHKNPNAKEIYQEHMKDIIRYVQAKGITPCIWGDVVREFPDMMSEFGDIVYLQWGYHPGNFNDECCGFYDKNNKRYMVCAGTSCWASISGRLENMMINYKEAAHFGKKHHAEGMMITDWNDGGSMSQLVTSMLAYVYGACYAWNDKNVDENVVNNYLNKNIYKANIAENVLNLGKYYTVQEGKTFNISKLFIMLYVCQIDGTNIEFGNYSDPMAMFSRRDVLSYNECIKTKKFLDEWKESFKCKSFNNQYVKEIMFSYDLIMHALNLNIAYNALATITADFKQIQDLLIDINQLIRRYDRLWHYRNKESDFKYSVKKLMILRQKYINLLYLMKGDINNG